MIHPRYIVLSPVVLRTSQHTPWSVPEEPSYWHRVEWKRIGTADSMQEARRKYGGYPVLEERKD